MREVDRDLLAIAGCLDAWDYLFVFCARGTCGQIEEIFTMLQIPMTKVVYPLLGDDVFFLK